MKSPSMYSCNKDYHIWWARSQHVHSVHKTTATEVLCVGLRERLGMQQFVRMAMRIVSITAPEAAELLNNTTAGEKLLSIPFMDCSGINTNDTLMEM